MSPPKGEGQAQGPQNTPLIATNVSVATEEVVAVASCQVQYVPRGFAFVKNSANIFSVCVAAFSSSHLFRLSTAAADAGCPSAVAAHARRGAGLL